MTGSLVFIDAAIVHNAVGRWFQPGAGNTEWFQDFETGPEMVVIPAGDFPMGSEAGEGDESERPRHKVTIAKPFAVSRFAITFAEWDAAVADGGVEQKPDDQGWGCGRRPAINVSWRDATAYVAWLSKVSAKTYRLLSEAEWEYCCRAGTGTPYTTGSTLTTAQARFSEGNRGSAGRTLEVGQFAPNAWGLYDMHGNVWEWCADSWHPNYEGAPQDGSVWPGGERWMCVMRGGSWDDTSEHLRSARRSGVHPGDRYIDVGIRVAGILGADAGRSMAAPGDSL
ncbi:MAG: formylglycine-generating enzyme family protein [Hyphomicrobiaceae bacterium]